MRRSAQAIQPFLYLGPSSATRDLDFMRREGVTMLLVIRNTMTAAASLLSGDKVARELGIQAAAVDVAGNQELIAAFPRACRIINDHLIAQFRRGIANGTVNAGSAGSVIPGKVFVFCESGNERSAAVVAAYLMSMFNLDLITAIQYVQGQRFCVAFDDGLKNLLLNYEELLNAQRCVSAASTMATFRNGPIQAKPKRRRDEEFDEEMSMDYSDDERFAGRGGFVPFQDNGAS